MVEVPELWEFTKKTVGTGADGTAEHLAEEVLSYSDRYCFAAAVVPSEHRLLLDVSETCC